MQVFARNAGTQTDVTGDGTTVIWIPDASVFDELVAYNAAAGVFTALGGAGQLKTVV